MQSRALAAGTDWRVDDLLCSAGPGDRRFEERHDGVCIALVTDGTFQYRTTQGAALLAPGALLLGNDGHCYDCGHEHGVGDRCLSFHYTPALFEGVAAALPGVRRSFLPRARLPALEALLPLAVAAEMARDEGDGAALEEVALRLAGAVLTLLAEGQPVAPGPSRRDERRVSRALRRIEADPAEPLSLATLAAEAAMSPYHFLRTFRRLTGATPHQYLLRRRLQAAALRLRRSRESIAAIAFEAGFNDLSSFNRRFRRVMGQSPGAYRRGGEGAARRLIGRTLLRCGLAALDNRRPAIYKGCRYSGA